MLKSFKSMIVVALLGVLVMAGITQAESGWCRVDMAWTMYPNIVIDGDVELSESEAERFYIEASYSYDYPDYGGDPPADYIVYWDHYQYAYNKAAKDFTGGYYNDPCAYDEQRILVDTQYGKNMLMSQALRPRYSETGHSPYGGVTPGAAGYYDGYRMLCYQILRDANYIVTMSYPIGYPEADFIYVIYPD